MSDGVVILTPQARVDLAASYAYIGERNPGAARTTVAMPVVHRAGWRRSDRGDG